MTRAPTGLITVFGLGRIRPASGTWGSLPPVLLGAAMLVAGLGPIEHPVAFNGALLMVMAVFVVACIRQGDAAEARSLRGKDPSEAVADEVAGQCLPLLFLPDRAVATPALAAFTLAYAFVCFRVLDVFKPWPAWRLQRVPAGWGIVLDDLVAGLYAAIAVQAVARMML